MKIEPQRMIKWEDWLAGRERRRAMSRLVAPLGARRKESSADKRLRKEFGGERGPDLLGGGGEGKGLEGQAVDALSAAAKEEAHDGKADQ